MRCDRSFGVIPLRREGDTWKVLLIKNRPGEHWDFPKGHPESDETAHDTAERELREETALEIIRFFDCDAIEERYQFNSDDGGVIDKTVMLFLAEVSGDVSICPTEVLDSCWLSLSDAVKRVTFPSGQRACMEAVGLVSEIS